MVKNSTRRAKKALDSKTEISDKTDFSPKYIKERKGEENYFWWLSFLGCVAGSITTRLYNIEVPPWVV